MNNKVSHVSASSIAAFKSCPIRYRIAYVEGLRQAQEPQPLRMGTAWHKGLEILEAPIGTVFSVHGIEKILLADTDNQLELAVEAATDVYTQVPDWADPTEWAVEREIVACALAAYHWLYPADKSEYETVATELEFDLPLVNPETRRSTPNFRRVGKIDRIIKHKGTGRLLIQENKSTSKSIDSDSTYWLRLRKDTQSKFYIVAGRDMQDDMQDEGLMSLPFQARPLISGLLHDVFHKPQISPKKLTQAESAEFVKTGEYCGQKFLIQPSNKDEGEKGVLLTIRIDGVQPELEPGKKEGTFALRETPGMFGARLLKDMTERPDFYFARREIAFTDDELLDFQFQIWSLQRTMSEMEKTGHWYENEQNCEATWKCTYCVLCYQNVDVFHGQTPPGFVRLHPGLVETTDASPSE